ncbi:hypothetical protein GCM10009087_40020 [Sphingomonas oligophenolica]|uniref:AraC family transcriptional regulator n=1 Tax=Sphingomonas oligophenolica TaxID=301154 RepID=A0ABU9Y283_9SPHN
MARASEEAGFARIEADLNLPAARIRMIRYRTDQPVDVTGTPPGYRLELALLPRPKGGRACFSGHWGPHRFEPIGEMFLIPPGEPLRAIGTCGDQLSVVCEFEPDSLSGWMESAPHWTSRNLERHLDIASPVLKASLHRLHDEIRSPGFASESLCELLSMQAAVDLARHCNAEGPACKGGLAAWRLRRIDERLADSATMPSLVELAALCDLSIRQLTRGYRATRGRSIGDDIVRARVDRAKRLLASDLPVKQIAHRLGFNAPANFSSAFARATGESPRQFRARLASSR